MYTDVSVVDGSAGHLRRRGVRSSVAWILLVQTCVQTSAFAQAPAPTVSTAATLTVLGGAVELLRPDGGRAAAQSGTSLSVGDRILTGAASRALVTFLDGTTVTVEPSSEITVREMEVGGRERSRIQVLITAGTVWARIANLLGDRGTVSLASNTHAAIAHDGLIGAEQRLDGSFACWTRAGTVQLVDAGGANLGRLEPGRKATISTGRRVVMEDFSVHRSVVQVTARGPVWPLVVMPGGVQLAGFVPPGIEVNQVFGSLTARRPAETWVVEVPGGFPGPYHVLLTGIKDGAFVVTIAGLVNDRTVFTRKWTGTIARGQRLGGGLTQEFDVRHTVRASEAETLTANVSSPRSVQGPTPGFVLLSPLEVAVAEGR
jgi:hypothetical protein